MSEEHKGTNNHTTLSAHRSVLNQHTLAMAVISTSTMEATCWRVCRANDWDNIQCSVLEMLGLS